MQEKRYKIRDILEFNIDIKRTLEYMSYGERYPRDKFPYPLHIAIRIYQNETEWAEWAISIYMESTGIAVGEVHRLKKQKETYEPSEEFIHILRMTMLIANRKNLKAMHDIINRRRY